MSSKTLVQPYAEQHAHLNGPGDSRPTAEDVIRDQGLINALPDHVILITGCTSGIGIETARALYLTGARVYITARDVSKAQPIATDLSTDPARPVQVLELSLDSFTSIRRAAATFLQHESRLHVLINNAGIMACPQGTTADGHELQLGTNHYGHFLLFQQLLPALLSAGTPSCPSRVVAVSSSAHRMCPALPFDDLDFSRSAYEPWTAYARSKLANIYFANEVTRRYGARHVHALSLHPGSIGTPLQRHVQGDARFRSAMADAAFRAQTKSVGQGAATTVWAAVGKEWAHRGGVYLDDVGEAGPAAEEGPSWRPGFGEAAFRVEDAERLWEVSCRACGVRDGSED